jgi:biopolymer transport protein ExbB/TolQ
VRPKLSRRLQYLTVLGSVAIMLGVIGTLLGARASLLVAGPDDGHATRLSAGLAAAVVPTIFGIAMAAVLALGRGYLVSQSESITEQLEEFSLRLINALIDRPDVRLGHR